jgi:predicted amidophosphoribosyltransferase
MADRCMGSIMASCIPPGNLASADAHHGCDDESVLDSDGISATTPGMAFAGLLWDVAFDLLLPAVCPGCRSSAGADLCADCLQRLVPLSDPCRWCAMPTAQRSPCPHCLDQGLAWIDRATAPWSYGGFLAELIGDAKAGARPAAVAACARLAASFDIAVDATAIVVPVPPSPGRRPGRHLATAMARAMAHRWSLTCARRLAVTRLADEQHRLGVEERRDNVEGLFVVSGDSPLPATVVLVDDILTSGATASAAARALRQAGAQRVVLMTLARTVSWS